MGELRFSIGVHAEKVWFARLSLKGWQGPPLGTHPRVQSDENGEYVMGYGMRIEDAVADAVSALGRVCLETAFMR